MAAVRTYPSDVKDEEWAFVAPYLCSMREDAPQREYAFRDLFNALCYLAHTGCPWRYLPHDLPPLGLRSTSNGRAGGMHGCLNLLYTT
jgi:transposase